MAPLVTVIIPVSPAHRTLLPDAIRSVREQTLRGQRIIVVNDAAQPLDNPAPDVLVLETGGGKWSSVARNLALAQVETPFVSFLDADDAYTNTALEMLARAYARDGGGYVYGGHYNLLPTGERTYYAPPRYDRQHILLRALHCVTTLVPTDHVRAVGGFNETLFGWEDWEFYIRLARAGFCGTRVGMPVITYRIGLGQNRNHSHSIHGLHQEIQAAYGKGITEMGCCPGNSNAQQAARGATVPLPNPPDADGLVGMEYIGPYEAPVSYSAHGRSYYAGLSAPFVRAQPNDVQKLLDFGVFRLALKASEQTRAFTFTTTLPPQVDPFIPGNLADESASLVPEEVVTSVAPESVPNEKMAVGQTTKAKTKKAR